MTAAFVLFVAAQLFQPAAAAAAECIRGADGRVACGFSCINGSNGRAVCAEGPGAACASNADGTVTCSRPPRTLLRVTERAATCVRGANGAVACGYACIAGSDGIARCANTPDGACGKGGDGKVVCTAFDLADRVVVLAQQPKPACVRTASGGVVCGYACLRGADGSGACANTSDGACAQGADGKVVCTSLDANARVWLGDPPQPVCKQGADGRSACGFGCVAGSDGRARCSEHPFGICDRGADGRVRCFPDD